MPLPAGLSFVDRIATDKKGAYFLCQRKGHPKVWLHLKTERDAIAIRTAHDASFHLRVYRVAGARPSQDVEIRPALKDWMEHVKALEVAGVRDPETTRYYELLTAKLALACRKAGVYRHDDITPSRLSAIVSWFRSETHSEGALIVKALSALKTIITWKGGRVDWKIPHDEIRAQPMEKQDLDVETIQKLIAAMPEGSVEEATAYLKARTGARDVEIYRSRPEEFHLDLGVFAPNISKRRKKKKRHVYVLTEDVIEKVRPFVERSKGYVFAEANGKHVTRATMRPRIMAAAKKAGFVKRKKNSRMTKKGKKEYANEVGAIDSIAQIRAEVVTIVEGELSLEEAARHVGHRSPSTASRWYVKDRITAKKIESRRKSAEIIAKAIPLGGV